MNRSGHTLIFRNGVKSPLAPGHDMQVALEAHAISQSFRKVDPGHVGRAPVAPFELRIG